MAFNLTRAVGVLAGRFHAKAVTATIRDPIFHRRRQGHPLGPPSHPSAADQVALGHRLAAVVHRSDRATTHALTIGEPRRP